MMGSLSNREKSNKFVVRKVLEDTGQAYTLMCESHINSDYADYASSQALESFQRALDNPDLTYDDLCAILRKASNRANTRRCKTPWSMFMANYIARHCHTSHRAGGMQPYHGSASRGELN
jgi:hypothetical protein